MRPIRNSAKAIIIRDGHVLANRMESPNDVWFDLPGGGQEPGEALEATVRRECLEEIGVEVVVHGLRFVRDYVAKNHELASNDPDFHMVAFMFLCSIADGQQPCLGPIPDIGPGEGSFQVAVEWLPIDLLEDYPLYPKALRPLIRDLANADHPVYLGDVN